MAIALSACSTLTPTAAPSSPIATPASNPTSIPSHPIASPTAVPGGRPVALLTELDEPRYLHSATLLPDGRVLIAGGRFLAFDAENNVEARVLESVELVDPATGEHSSGPRLRQPRWHHVALRLKDGRVLIVGGSGSEESPGPVSTAEIYDPEQETWTVVENVPVRTASATLLPDGRVLLIGSVDGDDEVSSSTLFDTTAETFSEAVGVVGVALQPAAVLLDDGRVLATGGVQGSGDGPSQSRNEAAIYDPTTDAWAPVAQMSEAHVQQSMVLLGDGRALVVGGLGAELFDPATATWTPTGSPLSERSATNLVRISNGSVVAIGSVTGSFLSLPLIETYDPAAGSWATVAAYLVIEGQTATLMPDGSMLLAGGLLECRSGQLCEHEETLADVSLFTP